MFALLATTAASTPNEPDTMDVDDDPEKLAEKIRLKIAELEAERAHAEDMFDDTTFIDKQIAELKEFMHELDTGLKEALSGGTKRERSQVDSVGTASATGAFVSKVGKSFRNFIDAGK